MRSVHRWLAAVSLVLAALGCQTRLDPPVTNGDPGTPQPARSQTQPASRPSKGGATGLNRQSPQDPASATNTPPSAGVVLPASGRIHTVNLGLRFVVIDYTLGGMPAMGSLAVVYRNNEKVAQVRLSGPEPRNGFVTADIMEGFIQTDDEVRLH